VSQANAYEQFMLELVNKARKDAGLAPLAMNGNINSAADLHTDYQLDVNKLTHTGSGGTTAYTRMKNAGYDFNGSSVWGENVGWYSISGTSSYQDEVQTIHTRLMNSSGHRANILNSSFREIGIGFDTGAFQGYNAAIATQDFAKSTGNAFLTGVSFDDKDGDRFYDVGEALAGVKVTAVSSSTGASFSTTGGTAGGYSLQLAAGTYKVTLSASGFASKTSTVTIGSSNVKLDWIDPAASSTTTTTDKTVTGTTSSETLTGGSGDDTLKGLAGNDTLKAGTGADTMYGGTGNDVFYVDNSGDIVTEYTKEGTDLVYSSVDHTLRDYLENLTLTGTGSNDGTGNFSANTIYGNDAANILKGMAGDDRLYGKGGNDQLFGGDGNDFFQGGAGTDQLTGGSGADKFDWNNTADVGKGTARDTILDFVRGSDKIDFSGIDANSSTTTNDSFTFIGKDSFNGVKGELRFYDGGTYAIVQGDVNGDRVADFELKVANLDVLGSTDFVL
jgi:serralysin